MADSNIEKEPIKHDRPYSQRELQTNRDKVFKILRVGIIQTQHKKCRHFYYVKENGKKEKEIKNRIMNKGDDDKENDDSRCSVCWKFSKTPVELKPKTRKMISSYCNEFCIPLSYLTYKNTDLEITFYKWLYS